MNSLKDIFSSVVPDHPQKSLKRFKKQCRNYNRSSNLRKFVSVSSSFLRFNGLCLINCYFYGLCNLVRNKKVFFIELFSRSLQDFAATTTTVSGFKFILFMFSSKWASVVCLSRTRFYSKQITLVTLTEIGNK